MWNIFSFCTFSQWCAKWCTNFLGCMPSIFSGAHMVIPETQSRLSYNILLFATGPKLSLVIKTSRHKRPLPLFNRCLGKQSSYSADKCWATAADLKSFQFIKTSRNKQLFAAFNWYLQRVKLSVPLKSFLPCTCDFEFGYQRRFSLQIKALFYKPIHYNCEFFWFLIRYSHSTRVSKLLLRDSSSCRSPQTQSPLIFGSQRWLETGVAANSHNYLWKISNTITSIWNWVNSGYNYSYSKFKQFQIRLAVLEISHSNYGIASKLHSK